LGWLRSHRKSLATGRVGYAQGAVALVIVGCLFVLGSVTGGPFAVAQSWLFGAYQRLWPPERSSSRTVVIEIDDESIRRFGQWPWPRDLLATLLTNLQGARAVGVDILMPDADRLSADDWIKRHGVAAPDLQAALGALPRPDEALEMALRTHAAVLAMAVDGNRRDPGSAAPANLNPVREHGDFAVSALPSATSVSWPLPILAAAAQGMGIVSAPSGYGEISVLPVAIDVGGTVVPGFAADLLRVALNAPSMILSGYGGMLSGASIGGVSFRVDPSGGVRPRFVGEGRLTTVKAYRVLDAGPERSLVHGKIAVVGVTAAGVGEPFRIAPGSLETSPAIQAEMIESLLAGDTLWRPFWAGPTERMVGLAFGLAAGFLLGRIRYTIFVSGFASALLIIVAGSIWLFQRHGILLDWVFPACNLVLLSLSSSAARIGVEAKIQRQHDAELAIERVRRAAIERELALRTEAETLRQSLALAVDAARLGVWDADLPAGTWHHSRRHDAILGLTSPPRRWSPDILLNQVVPEDRALTARSLAEGQASGPLQVECRIRHSDGSVGYVHILGRFWKDQHGVPSRVAGVVVDITKQRELELRLRQGEKLRAVGLLAGGVAHNFNNLLTVVLGNLELASGRLNSSNRTGALIGNAIEAAQKSASIARQLLAFARLQPLNPKPVDAEELLREIFRLLRSALPPTIEASLQMASGLGTVRIDPVDFELTLLNLTMNARDAMPAGGHLVVNASAQGVCDRRLGLDGDFLLLEVRDNGEGMSPETVSNVFEPFFTTKPIGEGTGLGLSQVHGFAHQSGGAVDIESVPGLGTCVRLYLPLTKREARPIEPRQREALS
jgi:signal transduction histidine kinase